ncbi:MULTISPECIES: CHASE2 domain-containing protein [Rhodomicrobium]|uniref:CHASE2 domain-containing protein n=1 Tax=Rhodomicrobium TaxID=1068 RepID=UPI0014822698|nr:MULTISPECIES: CHASE2 domain-containing protein [Rhodomicrobium]
MTEAVRTQGAAPRAGLTRGWFPGLVGAVWAVLVAVGLVALSSFGISPEGPDEWTYDWRTFFFSPTAPQTSRDIALILINEESMADYDYISPVDRGLTAKLIKGLDAAGPKVIGLDFIYDRKSEPAKTEALIEAIKTAKSPIVFGAIDRRVRGFRPEDLKYQDDFIARTGRDAGHVFFARDLEQLKIGDQVVRYLGAPSPDRESFAQLIAEKSKLPWKAPDSPYISWLLPPDGEDLFPLFKVPRHDPDAGPDVVLPESWRAALRGKIVLIGGDFVDRDKHLTPLTIWDGAKMPGVMVQAQILSQLLDGRSVDTLLWSTEIILLIVIAFLGYLFSFYWSVRRYDWLLYGIGVGVLVVMGAALFSQFGILIPSTSIFFAWTLGVTGGRYAPDVLGRLRLAG